ncbi:hypothetical protein F4561_000029 [Lipingzhangella halophila]|uniref:Uncharacterized protein n=1 Tax=Lipingzhangella halophila TaxID=1783352 RepID=A0A7W7RC47_9ACTN|nr:hypothetical protein [Lipingzhangella halophila]MBB4929209.1 hypothetical protein [Lipingzhangella halophila]
MELTQTSRGGATGCLLYSNDLHQMDAPIRAAGLTTDDLARFHELMLDPRLRVSFFPFVCTRGQKPMTG